MIALNAMFMSRKTQHGINGFSAVTSELRNFSGKLNKRMNTLSEQIATLVGLVATASKQNRNQQLILAAYRKANLNMDCIRATQSDSALNTAVAQLVMELERALNLIGIGQSLVVLAKVEANNAGELSQVLTGIANDMDSTIAFIEELIHFGQQQLCA